MTCGPDPKLGAMVHRFDQAATVCRCGVMTVVGKERTAFNQQVYGKVQLKPRTR